MHCAFCPAQLRSDNKLGACHKHRHRMRNHRRQAGAPSNKRCEVCGKPLRNDNMSGRCYWHRKGFPVSRANRPCRVPGCPLRRLAHGLLCVNHRALWRASGEYRTAAHAWRLFLAAEKKKGPPAVIG